MKLLYDFTVAFGYHWTAQEAQENANEDVEPNRQLIPRQSINNKNGTKSRPSFTKSPSKIMSKKDFRRFRSI